MEQNLSEHRQPETDALCKSDSIESSTFIDFYGGQNWEKEGEKNLHDLFYLIVSQGSSRDKRARKNRNSQTLLVSFEKKSPVVPNIYLPSWSIIAEQLNTFDSQNFFYSWHSSRPLISNVWASFITAEHQVQFMPNKM